MVKTILLNFKRLTGNKLLFLLLALAPLLLLSAFGSVIAPVFFSGGMEKVNIAVLNEDTNPLTNSITKGLVEDEKTRGLLSVHSVSTPQEGTRLLDSGAAALISVPSGFQETLQNGGQSFIGLRLNASKRLESALIRDVLESDVQMVNDAQKAVHALYDALVSSGMPEENAADTYYEAAKYFMVQALNRNAAIDVQGELSPLGRLMPVEYYASALLAVFLFFSAMSISAQTAQDSENSMLDRHLSSGRGYASYVWVRVASGAALILLQGIPAIGLILLATNTGFFYTGSLALAFPVLLLFACAVSAGGVWAGLLCKGRDAAAKVVFLIICIMAVLGGAVIPASGLGPFAGIAPYMAVNASMRLFSSSLFFFDQAEFLQSSVVLLAYMVLFIIGACITAKRKEA